jgi:hypothetical protein
VRQAFFNCHEEDDAYVLACCEGGIEGSCALIALPSTPAFRALGWHFARFAVCWLAEVRQVAAMVAGG